MKNMTSAEIRAAFTDFFEEMRHKHVASSSLVPGNDPTLLFANAGMVQFKDVFLGMDERPYTRATTVQKCMRVSGKHNDLENVGPSPRHHTFFEMLGNFSFGDYFKRDAIRFAYNLLTKVYEMPPDRLAYTVYQDDDEAYDIWVNDIGVPAERVARMGPITNFWQMAETGPCGPTSEIHWDKTPEAGTESIIDALQVEDDRFLEIWNLVFMQYNRLEPDPNHTGEFDEPLPATGVDTGAGFERIVSILQGKQANYETDLFMPIIERVQELTGATDEERDANIIPYRVIADHMRAATFLIADGVRPGATGRDYICRMVTRRAVRFGTKIGFEEPFLADVADAVVDTMKTAYPEIDDQRDTIRRTITNEEKRFRRAMDRALDELDDLLHDLNNQVKDKLREFLAPMFGGGEKLANPVPQVGEQIAQLDAQLDAKMEEAGAQSTLGGLVNRLGTDVTLDMILAGMPEGSKPREILMMAGQLPGEQAFRLHAEKGLPLEITRDIAKEWGYTVDEVGFRAAQKAHEAVSRGKDGGAFSEIDMGDTYRQLLADLRESGAIVDRVKQDQYGPLRREARLIALLRNGEVVESASAGEQIEAVLDLTPFYVESGGQVSDTGTIETDDWVIDVAQVRHPMGGLIVHQGTVNDGTPQSGEDCVAAVDAERRLDTIRNHTATHLLHAQLRAILGTHVQQRGSLVAPDRLRFDFSHDEAVTSSELDLIAHNINEAVLANMPVTAEWKDIETARAEGAMALFGEKYGDDVRTVNIWQPDDTRYSYELCGGNHVDNTGVIGSFVFTSEGSVAQGIRRVEALTGRKAEAYIRQSLNNLAAVNGQLGTVTQDLPDRVTALQDDLHYQQQEIARLRRDIARLEFGTILAQAAEINGVTVLVTEVASTATDTLREMTDWFRDRVDSGVIVLGMVAESGKPQLIAAATKDLKKRVHAGNIIKVAAKIVGGGGGGRPDMAQAGGRDADKLTEALDHAADLLAEALDA